MNNCCSVLTAKIITPPNVEKILLKKVKRGYMWVGKNIGVILKVFKTVEEAQAYLSVKFKLSSTEDSSLIIY